MKQYQDYKKQFKILILFSIFAIPFIFINAQSADELKNKINQKNSDIEKLEQDIKKYQNELDDLSKQKNSLSVSIKQLDLTRKKLTTDIEVTNKKIEKTNFKIQELGYQIFDKEKTIDNYRKVVSLGLRQINELENDSSLVERVLSKDNFFYMWNEIEDVSSISIDLRKNITELNKIKNVLEDNRKDTILAKNELATLKSELSDQKKIVERNTSEKNKLLSQTKNSETNYQKLLKTQLAKKEAFEKELRDFESELKFILDPSKLPGSGVLSWPLNDIYVTQEFGAKTGPHRTYASGHSGVDFRARTPLPVKAMADGIIKGTGDTDISCPGVSFGRFIFIEYNNGLSSTYGHLSLIRVSEGQRVSRGEIVGYTGGTGRSTAPHLHVSLYASSAVSMQNIPSKSCSGRVLRQPIASTNAYLDPMYYLPPYKR